MVNCRNINITIIITFSITIIYTAYSLYTARYCGITYADDPLGLTAAVSACANQQFGTNFHRICETPTLGNSLKVGLRAGYLSVRTAGGASDRH